MTTLTDLLAAEQPVNWIVQILPLILTSIVGGGGLTALFYIPYYKRKLQADSHKSEGEAHKLDTEADSTSFTMMRELLETYRVEVKSNQESRDRMRDNFTAELNQLRVDMQANDERSRDRYTSLRKEMVEFKVTTWNHLTVLETHIAENIGPPPPPRPAALRDGRPRLTIVPDKADNEDAG